MSRTVFYWWKCLDRHFLNWSRKKLKSHNKNKQKNHGNEIHTTFQYLIFCSHGDLLFFEGYKTMLSKSLINIYFIDTIQIPKDTCLNNFCILRFIHKIWYHSKKQKKKKTGRKNKNLYFMIWESTVCFLFIAPYT